MSRERSSAPKNALKRACQGVLPATPICANLLSLSPAEENIALKNASEVSFRFASLAENKWKPGLLLITARVTAQMPVGQQFYRDARIATSQCVSGRNPKRLVANIAATNVFPQSIPYVIPVVSQCESGYFRGSPARNTAIMSASAWNFHIVLLVEKLCKIGMMLKVGESTARPHAWRPPTRFANHA